MTMTTESMIPVGHATLRLRDLSSGRSPSFSPNLYRWMRRHAHFYQDGGVAEGVYLIKPGTPAAEAFGADVLMIGYPLHGHPGDTDFSGVRMMDVLCNGGKAVRWCYSNMAPDLDRVEGFWDSYLGVGRCAIDPKHQEHFMGGDRYAMEGDVRTCLWCGHQQRRIITQRDVYGESWSAI